MRDEQGLSHWNLPCALANEIPEFQPFLFLLLFMTAILIAFIVCKKKHLESIER